MDPGHLKTKDPMHHIRRKEARLPREEIEIKDKSPSQSDSQCDRRAIGGTWLLQIGTDSH